MFTDFNVQLQFSEDEALIRLAGSLDASTAARLQDAMQEAAHNRPGKLVIDATELTFMASAGLRCLVFARQKMGSEVDIIVLGAPPPVVHTIRMAGFDRSVQLRES
ncbi:MAG TPA: STAS domain-containing protein [Jatrophihabitans sp.]|nr:STAS domain-containing protein [Jatrophihabitans sp.]